MWNWVKFVNQRNIFDLTFIEEIFRFSGIFFMDIKENLFRREFASVDTVTIPFSVIFWGENLILLLKKHFKTFLFSDLKNLLHKFEQLSLILVKTFISVWIVLSQKFILFNCEQSAGNDISYSSWYRKT